MLNDSLFSLFLTHILIRKLEIGQQELMLITLITIEQNITTTSIIFNLFATLL